MKERTSEKHPCGCFSISVFRLRAVDTLHAFPGDEPDAAGLAGFIWREAGRKPFLAGACLLDRAAGEMPFFGGFGSCHDFFDEFHFLPPVDVNDRCDGDDRGSKDGKPVLREVQPYIAACGQDEQYIFRLHDIIDVDEGGRGGAPPLPLTCPSWLSRWLGIRSRS